MIDKRRPDGLLGHPRALRTSIRHRDNSLFYKTIKGARIGDFFMSVIHTCRLCGANPFDYLTTLRRHARQIALAPPQPGCHGTIRPPPLPPACRDPEGGTSLLSSPSSLI